MALRLSGLQLVGRIRCLHRHPAPSRKEPSCHHPVRCSLAGCRGWFAVLAVGYHRYFLLSGLRAKRCGIRCKSVDPRFPLLLPAGEFCRASRQLLSDAFWTTIKFSALTASAAWFSAALENTWCAAAVLSHADAAALPSRPPSPPTYCDFPCFNRVGINHPFPGVNRCIKPTQNSGQGDVPRWYLRRLVPDCYNFILLLRAAIHSPLVGIDAGPIRHAFSGFLAAIAPYRFFPPQWSTVPFRHLPGDRRRAPPAGAGVAATTTLDFRRRYSSRRVYRSISRARRAVGGVDTLVIILTVVQFRYVESWQCYQ